MILANSFSLARNMMLSTHVGVRHYNVHIVIIGVVISLLHFASMTSIRHDGTFVTIIAVDAFHIVPTTSIDAKKRSQTSLCLSAKRTSTDLSTIPDITRRMLAVTKNPNIAIVIDLENVRGKTNFELDHADLLDRLMVWTSLRNYAKGRTVVVVDHGRKSTAHLLHDHKYYHGRNGYNNAHDDTEHTKKIDDDDDDDTATMCVSFAGPRVKADDIIARDVKWLLSSPQSSTSHIVLITADQELTYRCRNAVRLAGKKNRNAVPFNIDSVAHNSIIRSFLDDSKRSNGRRRGRIKQLKEGGRKKKKSRAARKKETVNQNDVKMEGDDVDEAAQVGVDTDGGDGNVENTNATDTTTINITTADTDEQLKQHNFTIPTIEVISPQRFLEDLGQSLHEWLQNEKGRYVDDNDTAKTMILSEGGSYPYHSSQTLFQLRQKIVSLEASLRSTCSLHKRKGLTGELRKCKEEWKAVLTSIMTNSDNIGYDELYSSLACTFSSTTYLPKSESNGTTSLSSSSSTAWERLATREQDKLLMATRQENTGDRVVLAERLRRQLLGVVSGLHDEYSLEKSEDHTSTVDADGNSPALASIYADYINTMLLAEP